MEQTNRLSVVGSQSQGMRGATFPSIQAQIFCHELLCILFQLFERLGIYTALNRAKHTASVGTHLSGARWSPPATRTKAQAKRTRCLCHKWRDFGRSRTVGPVSVIFRRLMPRLTISPKLPCEKLLLFLADLSRCVFISNFKCIRRCEITQDHIFQGSGCSSR